MIIYNSLLAKLFLRKGKDAFMLGGIVFAKKRMLEFTEEMEMRIRQKHFFECVGMIFVIACLLAFFISWWFLLLIPLNYYLIYWLEKLLFGSSTFDREAKENCYDALYLRKRSSYAWLKYYGRSKL